MASDSFSEFVADQLAELDGVEIRRMFGGRGVYLKKVFFAIVADGKLYFKTNPKTLPAFEKAGSRPFTYEKKGKKTIRLKNYYEVPVDILENRRKLHAWALASAVEF